ncbi:Hypothetical_protein [Hexamita inflata]|uniref:Hypothetical_protein n=1 Tax=Hexamita inflata TaxID=28002 RepID=A0ABP1GL37_9EUKA
MEQPIPPIENVTEIAKQIQELEDQQLIKHSSSIANTNININNLQLDKQNDNVSNSSNGSFSQPKLTSREKPLDQQIKLLQQQNRTLQDKIEQSQRQSMINQTELKECQSKLTLREEELRITQEECQELNGIIQAKISSQSEAINQQLSKKLLKAEQKVEQMQNELQQNNFMISSVQLDYRTVVVKNQQLIKEVALYEEKIQKQILQLNNSQLRLEAKEKEKSHLQNTVLLMQTEAANRISDMNEKLSLKEFAFQEVSNQLQQCQQQLKNAKENEKNLNQQVQRELLFNQEETKKALNAQNHEFSAQLNQHIRQIEELNKEITSLTKGQIAHNDEIRFLKVEVAQKQQKIDKLIETEQKGINEVKHECQDKIKKLNKQIQILEQQQSVLQSHQSATLLVMQRENEILTLKATIQNMEKQNEIKQQQITQFISNRTKMEAEIKSLNEKISLLKGNSEDDPIVVIQQLNNKVDGLNKQINNLVVKQRQTEDQLQMCNKNLLEKDFLLKKIKEQKGIIKDEIAETKQIMQKEGIIKNLKQKQEELEVQVAFLTRSCTSVTNKTNKNRPKAPCYGYVSDF